ncbi:hypothetical protein EMMF5_006600, partial [Cystobasidiomycetes sp. EMM_F5]
MARDTYDYGATVQIYQNQTTSWLSRFERLRDSFRLENKLEPYTESYLSYLAEFYVAYWSLVVFSFALQHAIELKTKDLPIYLIKGVVYAKRILTATETELSRPSAVREAPDGHFEFVLHAAVFLLKVLPHLQESAELSHSLIERVAAL